MDPSDGYLDDSSRKKRRTIQFGSHPVALQDCDDEVERQKAREDEMSRRNATPRRTSFGKGATSRYIAVGGVPGSSLAQAKPLSAEELENLHRSCMELNQSNRINAQNSWNLKLIDYLHEVMNSSMSQNQNFQVAGFTIETSVKIYSSRIDSLESESLRVVGSLHRSDAKPSAVPDGPPADGAQREQPQSKRTHHVATLEANPENLDVRNLEAQFDVDPLFRITCSKFDAGGAAGLLLNNIRLGPYCQLMLDSSIVASAGEIDEDELWGGPRQGCAQAAAGDAGEDDDVNDAELQRDVEMGAEDNLNADACSALPEPAPALQEAPAGDSEAPLFEGDSDAGGDDGLDHWAETAGGQDTPRLVSTHAEGEPPALQLNASGPAEGDVEELQPAPDIEDQVMEKNADNIAQLLDPGDEFSYFKPERLHQAAEPPVADPYEASECDSELENMTPQRNSGWTGTIGHWKFRATRSTEEAQAQPREDRKKTKETHRIDLGQQLSEADCKAFEPPKDPYSTLLKCGRDRARALAGKLSRQEAIRALQMLKRGTDPKAMLLRAKRKGLHLPDDNHFDLDSLFQPFMRSAPEWNLKWRASRRRQQSGQGPLSGAVEENGVNAPDDRDAAGHQPQVLPELEEDAVRDDAFATDAQNDFDDGPDVDDTLNIAAAEQEMTDIPASTLISGVNEGFNLPNSPGEVLVGQSIDLVKAPDLVSTVKVNYSRVAKQIDIKRLKDFMWARICEAMGSSAGFKRKRDYFLKFTDLIESLRDDVPLLGNPSDVTISFYFISLLHIANEQGLELQGLPCLTDLHIMQPDS